MGDAAQYRDASPEGWLLNAGVKRNVEKDTHYVKVVFGEKRFLEHMENRLQQGKNIFFRQGYVYEAVRVSNASIEHEGCGILEMRRTVMESLGAISMSAQCWRP